MRKLLTLMGVLGLVALTSAILVVANASANGEEKFKLTNLSGDQVPTSVTTDMIGEMEVELNEAATEMKFELEVDKVAAGTTITAAHLHCGDSVTNGSVIVGIFAGAFVGDGRLAEGVLVDANLTPGDTPCAIDTLSDLADAMNAGNVYINVHTVANSGGEIRGQFPTDP